MPLNRRDFALSCLATFASGALLHAEEVDDQNPINAMLRKIKKRCMSVPSVAYVEEHFVEDADTGLVEWAMAHFRHDISQENMRYTDRINSDLLPAMREVHSIPNAGLDRLLHENFVKGENTILEYIREHRALISGKFTKKIPRLVTGTLSPQVRARTFAMPIPSVAYDYVSPSYAEIHRQMRITKNMYDQVTITAYPQDADPYALEGTMLGRLGAGYALSCEVPVHLLSAEDPEIYAKALHADAGTDRAAYEKYVWHERNKHFISLAREFRGSIAHLFVGMNHNLETAVRESNKSESAKISYLVVIPNGGAELECSGIARTSL